MLTLQLVIPFQQTRGTMQPRFSATLLLLLKNHGIEKLDFFLDFFNIKRFSRESTSCQPHKGKGKVCVHLTHPRPHL